MRPQIAGWGRRYAAWRVSRELDGLHVAGLSALQTQLQAGPVVMMANHVAWWDGLVALALGHQLGAEVALIARAETLQRFPWMAAVGVIPLQSGWDLRKTLRDAGQFLNRPQKMLWFFPQGRQRPAGLQPLDFQSGLRLFARLAPSLPVALAYPFREVEVPAAALWVGQSVPTEAMEASVVAGLGAIDRWADGTATPEDALFSPVIASRRQPQQQNLASRLLGVLS